MYFCDGMPHASGGEWECPDCGQINQRGDAACECELERESRELARQLLVLAKIESLSPRERRERGWMLHEMRGRQRAKMEGWL
jgi:hypothetical protein